MNPEYYTGTDNTPQVRNYKTATGYYSGAVSGIPTTTITASSLAPTLPITIPQPQADKTNYNQLIAGGNAFISGSQLPAETQSPQSDLTKQLNDLIGGQPSTTDLYNTAYNASGIDVAQQDALAKKRAVRAAQSELGGIQAQLQAVADSAKQQNLQLEQSINQGTTGAGGAGALASGSFLNVRQQEINRQAAIASLPLQAQALAAQAKVASLQGDAEYAQSTLAAAQEKQNTFFKILSEDSTRKQDLQMKMFDIIYNDANKREQQQIDALKQQSTTNQSNLTDARNFAQQLSASALSNGQANIAAQITQIPQPDITSKTFAQDLQEYNAKVSALQGQIKPKPEKATAAEIARGLPLSVLDVARYQELYPDAGVTAGDTEAQANAKVQASNSPEAKTRSMVVAAQTNGATYDTVVKEINGDATIKDKSTALAIAKEVYGVQDVALTPIETEIAQMKASNILTDADMRSVLVKRYGQQAVNNSSIGSWMDKIGSFLFK